MSKSKLRKKRVAHAKTTKTTLRAKIALIFLLSVVLVLQAIKLQLQNDLAGESWSYASTVAKTAELKKENLTLYDEILNEESLTTIYQKAKDRGFVEAKNYVFLQGR